MKQQSLATLTYEGMKKRTKSEQFLKEMEQVVPWERLEKLIEPHYPRVGKGRPPKGLKVMLRIYCLQQWYGLSDPGVEDALYDMESMRRFAGLELGEDAIPDETTILNFRHLLEANNLTSAVFDSVKTYLGEQGLLLGGSIVDATIIHAPPSTKNQKKERDTEMSSTNKGSSWYFGMKAHISVDANNGLVHTVGVTTASDHDNSVIGDLIREDDRAVFGDKGYASDKVKRAARQAGVYWAVLDKAKRNRKLSATQRKKNKKMPRLGQKWNTSSASSSLS
jgi:transposase, IS5 family